MSEKPRLTVIEDCSPSPQPQPNDVREYAALFKALADETRLEIVALLVKVRGTLCACDIEAHFDLSQSTISHHLKTLRKAGVLTSQRRGTWIHYGVDASALARVDAFTGKLR